MKKKNFLSQTGSPMEELAKRYSTTLPSEKKKKKKKKQVRKNKPKKPIPKPPPKPEPEPNMTHTIFPPDPNAVPGPVQPVVRATIKGKREPRSEIEQAVQDETQNHAILGLEVSENYADGYEKIIKRIFDKEQEAFDIEEKVALVLRSQGVDIGIDFGVFRRYVTHIAELEMLRQLIAHLGLSSYAQEIMTTEIEKRFGRATGNKDAGPIIIHPKKG